MNFTTDQHAVDPAFRPVQGNADEYELAPNAVDAPKAIDLTQVKIEKDKCSGDTSAEVLYGCALYAEQEIGEKDKDQSLLDIARYRRNRLQSYLTELSDRVCEEHKAAIVAVAATANFATSLTSTVLASVSSIVTGGAASNLAAASSMFGALQTQLNSNFYQNLVAAAVVRRIESMRRVRMATLVAKQRSDITRYSVDAAVRDTDAYHRECSFYKGLVSLTKAKAKRDVLSRGEIEAELKSLRDENEKLLKKTVADTKVEGGKVVAIEVVAIEQDSEYGSGLRLSYEMNLIRIHELEVLRNTARGAGAAVEAMSKQPKSGKKNSPQDGDKKIDVTPVKPTGTVGATEGAAPGQPGNQ